MTIDIIEYAYVAYSLESETLFKMWNYVEKLIVVL